MRRFTEPQFMAEVKRLLDSNKLNLMTDEDGQLIIYTGFYEHNDGAIYDEPELWTSYDIIAK